MAAQALAVAAVQLFFLGSIMNTSSRVAHLALAVVEVMITMIVTMMMMIPVTRDTYTVSRSPLTNVLAILDAVADLDQPDFLIPLATGHATHAAPRRPPRSQTAVRALPLPPAPPASAEGAGAAVRKEKVQDAQLATAMATAALAPPATPYLITNASPRSQTAVRALPLPPAPPASARIAGALVNYVNRWNVPAAIRVVIAMCAALATD